MLIISSIKEPTVFVVEGTSLKYLAVPTGSVDGRKCARIDYRDNTNKDIPAKVVQVNKAFKTAIDLNAEGVFSFGILSTDTYTYKIDLEQGKVVALKVFEGFASTKTVKAIQMDTVHTAYGHGLSMATNPNNLSHTNRRKFRKLYFSLTGLKNRVGVYVVWND